MNNIILNVTCLGALIVGAVCACAEAQPVLHDANTIAKEACALYFSGKQGLSFDDAAREFCKDRAVLDVFLGSQQRAGLEVERQGLVRTQPDAGAE